MEVGDIVFTKGNKFQITGIYLGVEGQQNLVGLKSLELVSGNAHGVQITEMYVPEELVVSAGVYRCVIGGIR